MTQKVIKKKITIKATKDQVWNALTIPELMKAWMFDAEIEIISEMKERTEIIIRGVLNDHPFENKGTIQIFEPEYKFQYSSLSSLSNLVDEPANYSLLTFELSETNSQTTLIFTQSNFPGKASYEHSNFYWGSALLILKKFIE